MFISGAANITAQDNGFQKVNELLFAPKIGFFVSDNFTFGLGLGLGTMNNDRPRSIESQYTKQNITALTLFGRYYATPSSKFSLFGQFQIQNSATKFIFEESEEVKINGFGLELAPGISYFLNKHFALEATGSLGYATAKGDYRSAEASTNFNLNLDLTAVNFGLVYKF